MTHKKIISTNSITKPIYRSLPSKLPYIAVEWTSTSNNGDSLDGYAHVIQHDDKRMHTSDMNTDFCYDIMSSVFEEDNMRSRRKRNVNTEVKDRAYAAKFKSEFETFDWTSYLDDAAHT